MKSMLLWRRKLIWLKWDLKCPSMIASTTSIKETISAVNLPPLLQGEGGTISFQGKLLVRVCNISYDRLKSITIEARISIELTQDTIIKMLTVSQATLNKKSSLEIKMGEDKIGQSRLWRSLANWSRTIRSGAAPKVACVKCQLQQGFEFQLKKDQTELVLIWDKVMDIKCYIIKLQVAR